MGGWVSRCRRWRKNSLFLLAACMMTTPHFPQAPQQSQLLSKIILSFHRSSRLNPQRCYDQLQMLGWPLMSASQLRWAEGWHHRCCLNSCSIREAGHSFGTALAQLSSGQIPALASHTWLEQGCWQGGSVLTLPLPARCCSGRGQRIVCHGRCLGPLAEGLKVGLLTC